jgi:RNA polymerase sigma-70 factor (ECF subfamily)
MLPPTTDAPSRTVKAAFARRDPAAVRSLYRAYGGLVYTIALRILRRADLAEDATQQTFVQAWQAADRFDVDRDPAPWLATIARHVALDLQRYEARRPVIRLEEAPDAAKEASEPVDLVWQVRRAIDALPADEATVLRLQHLDGLTQNEVASRLGLALGTVKSRSHRAHRRLEARLAALRAAIAAGQVQT